VSVLKLKVSHLMRITAYVLVADPAFLVPSVRAYYDRVDRIVLSYDRRAKSWTGSDVPVSDCLERLHALDVDGKCVDAPGDFFRPEFPPMDNDTNQRQHALDAASDDADWVLQLDTDEVMPNPARFFASLERAEATGASGLEYPSRWLHSRVGPGRYLEGCTRFWRSTASFPGPLAARAGTQLRHGRQLEGPLHRVDIRPWNTDAYHQWDAPVHEVVRAADAVVHYSWVRRDEAMRRKVRWSGHSEGFLARDEYALWRRRADHPRATALLAPLRSHDAGRYRIGSAPDFDGEPA